MASPTLTFCLDKELSASPGCLPELVFGGPDASGTVWVKIYRVVDPAKSSCPEDCDMHDHRHLPVLRVLERVVWYHQDLVSVFPVPFCPQVGGALIADNYNHWMCVGEDASLRCLP